jgi:predicted alpha/beta superfamily hydrolase
MTVLEQTQPTLALVLPSMRCFEIDSRIVGARFAVFVSLPPRYDLEPDRSYPAVYQPDGNQTARTTTNGLLVDDPIAPIEPLIQVHVGYPLDDVRRGLALRARDLLPPGEPVPDGMDEESVSALATAGLLSQPDAELYLHHLRHPGADRYLRFLTEELHPLIAQRFRVDEQQLGLHGYSYGGLFAAWVAMQHTIFMRIGAGSPGILPDVSQVLTGYDAELAAGTDHTGRMLHVTLFEKELTESATYHHLVGTGTVQLFGRLTTRPLPGLTWSSRILPDESHATGGATSFYSYLRACWSARAPTTLLTRTER